MLRSHPGTAPASPRPWIQSAWGGQFLFEAIADRVQPRRGRLLYQQAARMGGQQRLPVNADAFRCLFVHAARARRFSISSGATKRILPP